MFVGDVQSATAAASAVKVGLGSGGCQWFCTVAQFTLELVSWLLHCLVVVVALVAVVHVQVVDVCTIPFYLSKLGCCFFPARAATNSFRWNFCPKQIVIYTMRKGIVKPSDCKCSLLLLQDSLYDSQ